MATREILHDDDPVLRKISKPVNKVSEYVCRLLDDMVETLHTANGVGLAAPQIGVLRRVAIVEIDDVLYELINPEIVSKQGAVAEIEACLSIPGRAGIVERPLAVTVRATNRDGETKEYSGENLFARAVCHELDHLDGRLYTDIMIEEVDLTKQDEQDEQDEQDTEETA